MHIICICTYELLLPLCFLYPRWAKLLMTYQVQDAGLLDDMQDPEELRSLSAWKVHTPTGDRKGTWSLSVTRKPPDMALRVEKAFGVKMDTLLRMQASYDIAQTRKREKQIHVLRIHHVAPFTRQEISTRWRSHVRVCRASASSKSPYRKCLGVKHLDPRECSAPAGALVDTTRQSAPCRAALG